MSKCRFRETARFVAHAIDCFVKALAFAVCTASFITSVVALALACVTAFVTASVIATAVSAGYSGCYIGGVGRYCFSKRYSGRSGSRSSGGRRETEERNDGYKIDCIYDRFTSSGAIAFPMRGTRKSGLHIPGFADCNCRAGAGDILFDISDFVRFGPRSPP